MIDDDSAERPAYGLFQILDSTWAMYGGKPVDPAEQARIGLDYIKARYGNVDPTFWHRPNWYDGGAK